MSSQLPSVRAARLAATRLHDLAYAIDLAEVERNGGTSTRLRLARAKPRAVFHADPPLDIALGSRTLDLGSTTLDVEVAARVFALGAVRISYATTVRSLPFAELTALANALVDTLDGDDPWREELARVRALVAGAMEKPVEAGLCIDHLFVTIESFDTPVPGAAVSERFDLVPLLTGESRPMAESARREVLRHSYGYYADDLVVINPGRALIVEPDADPGVADVLTTAQMQLLELRYYDQLLDRELGRMYDGLEDARRGRRGLANRGHAGLARDLHALVAEVTEVSERIDNALVVTEDVYLARVYRAALDQYRVRDWRTAVDRKLAIIRDTYTALYDETTASRAEWLEITIVLLIAFEIVWALLVL